MGNQENGRSRIRRAFYEKGKLLKWKEENKLLVKCKENKEKKTKNFAKSILWKYGKIFIKFPGKHEKSARKSKENSREKRRKCPVKHKGSVRENTKKVFGKM